MEKKVRIISFSGMPVSGKSTVIKEIQKKLKNDGTLEENIHLVSTGKRFRDYFNKIGLLIDNKDRLEEISDDEDIKRLLCQTECGKKMRNIIINLIKKGYTSKDINISQANNNLELKELRDTIDTIIDSDIEKMGKEIIKRNNPEEVWLIDSRLAFHNIPESFSVRLTVDNRIAGKRLFNDRKRGNEDNNYISEKEAEAAVKERGEGENKRFKSQYNIDLKDENNYNLIIDTSFSKVEDVADVILTCEECEREGKKYAKNWIGTKQLLPTQSMRETEAPSFGGLYTLEELKENIKENGYIPYAAIYIMEVNNKKYILDGHHANFALAELGKTLIPYEIKKSDRSEDEKERDWVISMDRFINPEMFRGYESFFEGDFSYDEVYPEIYQKKLEDEQK